MASSTRCMRHSYSARESAAVTRVLPLLPWGWPLCRTPVCRPACCGLLTQTLCACTDMHPETPAARRKPVRPYRLQIAPAALLNATSAKGRVPFAGDTAGLRRPPHLVAVVTVAHTGGFAL